MFRFVLAIGLVVSLLAGLPSVGPAGAAGEALTTVVEAAAQEQAEDQSAEVLADAGSAAGAPQAVGTARRTLPHRPAGRSGRPQAPPPRRPIRV